MNEIPTPGIDAIAFDIEIKGDAYLKEDRNPYGDYVKADDARRLEKELAELRAWKHEACQVFTTLPLQEIGKVIKAPLGSNICPKILPFISAQAARIAELEGALEDMLDDKAVLQGKPRWDACERARKALAAELEGALDSPEALAKSFHATYERLAKEFNYKTRTESAVPWDSVPENNRRLMIAVCAEIAREALKPAKTPGGCAVGPY